ncbi:MAG: hypothetical protein IT422_02370 [Pirellulaceae bacterium]|nr:hypothetical protein [Pirellulaceae bacterium]
MRDKINVASNRLFFADEWSHEDGLSVKLSGGPSDEWSNGRYEPTSLWAYQPLRRVTILGDSNSAIDDVSLAMQILQTQADCLQ